MMPTILTAISLLFAALAANLLFLALIGLGAALS